MSLTLPCFKMINKACADPKKIFFGPRQFFYYVNLKKKKNFRPPPPYNVGPRMSMNCRQSSQTHLNQPSSSYATQNNDDCADHFVSYCIRSRQNDVLNNIEIIEQIKN